MKKDNGKIIGFGSQNICLFCGKAKEKKWEEYQPYWECNCDDAQKDRKILLQIRTLESQRPKENFQIRSEHILYKIPKAIKCDEDID